MTRLTDELTKHAAEIHLSSAERSRIQKAVIAGLEPIPSPFDFSTFLIPRLALTGLMVLVLAFTGTAYASQYSLPGDMLYGVKVGITEPVTRSFAFTDSAKVAWHAEVAETRLAEAEALTITGDLTAETGLALAEDVRMHREAVDTIARKIGMENPISEDRIAATFSNSVANKGNAILAAGKKTANPIAMRASGDLVVQVAGNAAGGMAGGANMAMEAMPESRMMKGEPAMMMSLMMTDEAQQAPEDVYELAMRAREAQLVASSTLAASTLDETATADAAARLANLAELMVKAEAEFQLEDTDAAIADFKRAIEMAAEIHAQIEAN